MLQQARAFLKGGFALMDVRITDPTFPIQSLSPDLVDSITLVLSGETEQARLKQILKFVERKAGYVAKGVRQAVANVTSAVELRQPARSPASPASRVRSSPTCWTSPWTALRRPRAGQERGLDGAVSRALDPLPAQP
jgi:hypothetical protein